MPRQVFSVFATPHFLSRVSSIIIGLCGPGFSMIPRSVQRSFLSWNLVWIEENFSLNSRVHFKVKFIAAPPPPPPPVRFSPTVKAVKPFLNLSLKLFWSEWPMDLCRSGGSWGKCLLPTWLCPSPLNLQSPACAMMRDFLNLWIKYLPFSLDLTTDLPRYVHNDSFQTTCDDKSGYDHVRLSPDSRTYFGLQWNGWYFAFNTLPFGWKASAYLYHSIGLIATSYIRSHGVPCSQYIDDRHFGELQIRRTAPPCSWSGSQRAQAALYIA